MNIDIRNSHLQVREHGLVAIHDGGGTRITCHSGTFWITQEGRQKDDVLRAGETLVVGAPGKTVVTALSDGEITLTEPCRHHEKAAGHAWWPTRFRAVASHAPC
ncbi:MAG: DUF2917 domain-containing protein [Burkholderiales bacterium]